MHYLKPILIIISLLSTYSAYTSDITQVRIINARIIESPPVTGMNAGYLEIENTNSHPVVLTGVTSKEFSRIEIHQSVIKDGVAKMKKMGPLTIPAQSRRIFRPGDYHLMLFKATRTLQAGDAVSLRFHFSDGQTVDTAAIVVPVTSR